MRDAYLIGAGQSPFGRLPDESYRSLYAKAFDAALASVPNGFAVDGIEEAFTGTLGVGGRQLGLSSPAVTEHVGLGGVPSTRVENACASSGFAIRQAVQTVRSGLADVVLAGGVEVMSDLSGETEKYWLGVSGEMEWERLAGTTFAGTYAQMATAHMEAFGTTLEQLARVAVKNHANGAANPDAHLAFACELEDVMEAGTVADPLTVYHCCPTSDGAACALVASEDVVTDYTDRPIRIAGVGAGSDRVGLFQRVEYTRLRASERAANRAYQMAECSPAEIDIAEVHDCFSIAELLAYEDLGFCERGRAGEYIDSGETEWDGTRPVNTSGGLKSKGHPIGATGAGQAVEIFKQLSGTAGERQVPDVTRGLTHNVGGSGGAAVVQIFEREEA